MRKNLLWALLGCLTSFAGPLLADSTRPLIIGHRGACGYRPEHTLASYQLAMEMGADFIEPDLVSTRDGVLVARHEPNLIDTTDVKEHPEFASRRAQKLVDGKMMDGFFVEDFSFAEIKSLRAIQSHAYRDQSYNALYEIPSFPEIIDLVLAYEAKTGRKVGIYPETKHPTYFQKLGLSLEEKLLDTLVQKGFTDPDRIFIQSFEVHNLRDILKPMMAAKGLHLPLIQLIDELSLQPADYMEAGRTETYGDLIQAESLKTLVATYARGIGPWKASIVKRRSLTTPNPSESDRSGPRLDELTGEILPLIPAAHAAGLLVHVYTLRNELRYLAQGYATPEDEYEALAKLGVDGFFSDFPDTAKNALSP